MFTAQTSAATPNLVGYRISVEDTTDAGYTTATVTASSGDSVVALAAGRHDNYVFVQCYAPDLSGAYVYGAFFPARRRASPAWPAVGDDVATRSR